VDDRIPTDGAMSGHISSVVNNVTNDREIDVVEARPTQKTSRGGGTFN